MAKRPAKAAAAAATASAAESTAAKVISVKRVGNMNLPLHRWRAKCPTGEEWDDIEADHVEDVVRIVNSRLDRGRTFAFKSLEIEDLGEVEPQQIEVETDDDESESGQSPLQLEAPPAAQ